MAIPLDNKLYSYVKKLADKKFNSKTSVYKSSWIVHEYKKRGGKYQTNSNYRRSKTSGSKSSGLTRWYKEKWIDLNRPVHDSTGKIIGYESCGRKHASDKTKYPLCRPSKRVTLQTPRTYKELSKNSIDQAKKIKFKNKGNINVIFKGGNPQYYGKNSSIMIKVPENVKKWAIYAFKLRKQGFQGATRTGWLRAKQLATKKEIPIEDLRYMRNWYARHIYTSYPGFKKWIMAGKPKDVSWQNKHAILSWITWSGNAGLKWVNSSKNINLLNKYFNKKYDKIIRC